jgi:CRISPR system Cascade subunit CasE
LERKLEGCAALETLIAEKRLPLNFRKARGKRVGKIQPVSFQGVLTVQKASAIHDLIVAGIGPAKAFGCGMLSLARA